MTPARAQLESLVDVLRRKQLLAIAITALVEMLLVAACVYALLRLGLPNLALSKPRRLALAFGMVLVFFAAILLEQARQSRSVLYLAKRIDKENQLDDHLISALSFADPTTLPFEQACVDSLVLRLQSQVLRIPEVRLERLWLLLPALLVAGLTGAVEYRRKARPADDGNLRIAMPGEVRDSVAGILTRAEAARGKVDPTLAKRAEETRAMLDKILERSATKESVMRDLSTARETLAQFEADNPSLVDAAMQLGDPATQRASQFLSAMRSGDPASVASALKTLSDVLAGKVPPPPTAEEREEISAMLKALADKSRAGELQTQLKQAADEVRDSSKNTAAAKSLAGLAKPLGEQLSREDATKQVARALRSAIAEVSRQTEIETRKQRVASAPSQPGGPADGGTFIAGGTGPGSESKTSAPDDEVEDRSSNSGTGDNAKGGAGKGTAAGDNDTIGKPETAETKHDVRISSPWVGAAVKQLVAAGSSSDPGAQEAARAILRTQQRALENDVRREEIPAEYAQSIRRYFSNIKRDWERH